MQAQFDVTEGSELIALLDRALPEVYGYLLLRCRNKATAEDITSETMLAAVRRVRDGVSGMPEAAWLISVARNKLVDHWRAEERRSRYLTLISVRKEASIDASAIDVGIAQDVLAELTQPHRAALTLRHMDGLSVPEVAALLHRSVQSTETLLARARTAFRRHYREKMMSDE